MSSDEEDDDDDDEEGEGFDKLCQNPEELQKQLDEIVQKILKKVDFGNDADNSSMHEQMSNFQSQYNGA